MFGLQFQTITAASVLLGGLFGVGFPDNSTLQTVLIANRRPHQLALYVIARCAYMLFFHPLAKYPVPRLAAVSDVSSSSRGRALNAPMLNASF